MVEFGRPQIALKFRDDLAGLVAVLESRDRHAEITRVGEAVGADRSELREPKQRAVILADITPRAVVAQLDTEFEATGDDGDLARTSSDNAQLGGELQTP